MVSKKSFTLLVNTETIPIFVVVPIYFVHGCRRRIKFSITTNLIIDNGPIQKANNHFGFDGVNYVRLSMDANNSIYLQNNLVIKDCCFRSFVYS